MMMRLARIAVLLSIFVGLLDPESSLSAEPRIALVIGNGSYAETPLANPVNDARLMAETLRGLGFEVNELTDADQRAMKIAILAFGDRLEAAGQDAVGLFYYAGHGLQVGAQNYLVPLNSAIRREKDVAVEAVSAGWVLGQMEFAANRVNFVILDACRNNPLTRSFRSPTRGLARMDAPRGSLVAYSTGPGEVAADGTGANSPYTLALSQAMQTPGVPAEKMFKLVRDSVMAETKGDQTPWEESSLTGADFYFSVDVSVTVEAPEAPAAASITDTAATTQQETVFWQSIKDSTNPAMFEAYLEQYPNGRFAALARIQLKKLKETETAAVVPPPAPAVPSLVEEIVGIYPQPQSVFRDRLKDGGDCPFCPEMVVVPAGSFMMGSPASEEGRFGDEGPQHRVEIERPFAMGKYEVTRREFATFVREAGYSAGGNCWVDKGGGDFGRLASKNWRDPNFSQTDRDPVLCVSWGDANAYVEWLGRKTGERYRLPSESEWEYAARAGTTAARYWGNNPDAACTNANVGDRSAKETYANWTIHNCRDGHVYTAPVGSFRANSFGLYDVLGNVWEWVEDCWNDSYSGAPIDGSTWTRGECEKRVLRGGSWGAKPRNVRSANRVGYLDVLRYSGFGFRVARTLTP